MMSGTVALVVPERFRLVIEGPLHVQIGLLCVLREYASDNDCILIATAERAEDAGAMSLDDELAHIAAVVDG